MGSHNRAISVLRPNKCSWGCCTPHSIENDPLAKEGGYNLDVSEIWRTELTQQVRYDLDISVKAVKHGVITDKIQFEIRTYSSIILCWGEQLSSPE